MITLYLLIWKKTNQHKKINKKIMFRMILSVLNIFKIIKTIIIIKKFNKIIKQFYKKFKIVLKFVSRKLK